MKLGAEHDMAAHRLTCWYCREDIGRNEPALLIDGKVCRETSIALEPELSDPRSLLVMHARCTRGGTARAA